MRVVFTTLPVPARQRLPNGDVADGFAYFEARVYGPNEPGNVPGVTARAGRPVAEWLAGRAPGQAFHVPGTIEGTSEAVIPAAIIDRLPRDSRLQLLWFWTRKGAAT